MNTVSTLAGQHSSPRWSYPHHFENLFLWNGLDKRGPGAINGEPDNCYVLNLNNQYRLDKILAGKKGSGVCIYDAIEPEVWNSIERESGYLVLDMAVECLFTRQDIAEGIIRGIQDYAIDPERVVIVNSNINSENYFNEQFFNALPKRPKIIGFDSCFWLISGINKETHENSPNLQMRHAAAKSGLNIQRGKKFVSFNGRHRPHRFYVILWMLENGLLEESHVSFLGYQSHTYASASELTTHYLAKQYPHSDTLACQAGHLLDRLPLSIDVSLEESQAASAFRKDLAWMSQSKTVYDDAYFSVVIDTEVSDDNLFLTPIAYKSFMNLSPFVYFGNPGALEHMRRLGFKTFSPYIDESYDQETNWRTRMKLALDEINKLGSMSMHSLQELYAELWPILEHNYWHFYREAPRTFVNSFQKEVFEPLELSLVS